MNHLFGSKPSLNLEAGTGFEPVMLRAYETAVVTTLPAVILADKRGIEPRTERLTVVCSTSELYVKNWYYYGESNSAYRDENPVS